MRDQLPVAGVDLILLNDLTGNKVFPLAPELTENPITNVCITSAAPDAPSVFPVCVATHAQAHKLGDIFYLSDSFLNTSEVLISSSSEQKNKPCLSDYRLTKPGYLSGSFMPNSCDR